MTTVWLHVGQAGNQVGGHLWQRHADYIQPLLEQTQHAPASLYCPGMSSDAYARALLIDTEPKVVAAVHRSTQCSRSANTTSQSAPATASIFRGSNIVYEQSGRGNNWALGYTDGNGPCGTPGKESIRQRTLRALELELERSDVSVDGVCIVSSTSGGTGSGVGSGIVESIRELYPKLSILSCCVLPYSTGETPLQYYNSLFTLAYHYTHADGVLLFNNNDVHAAITHATARYSTTQSNAAAAGSAQSVSFDWMNQYISDCILDVLSPVQYATTLNGDSASKAPNHKLTPSAVLPVVPCRISDLIQHHCPLSSIKLLEAYTTSGIAEMAQQINAAHSNRPKTATQRKLASYSATHSPSVNWPALCDQLYSLVPKGPLPASTFAYSIYARGNTDNTWNTDVQQRIDTRMQKLFSCVPWNDSPCQYIPSGIPPLSYYHNTNIYNTKSLSLCVNRAYNGTRLASLLARAELMYDQRAFTHWYERYGVGAAEFAAAFDTVHNIVDDYTSLQT